MLKIFFLGCGKMGSILAKNISNSNPANQLLALDINGLNPDVNCVDSFAKIPKNYQADIVFFAIKPQDSSLAIVNFAKEGIFHENTIFISILAGKKVQFFEEILGENCKIVRSMPNLPVSVGNGIFPYFCNKNLNVIDKRLLQQIFQDFGYSFEIENEESFNSLTAICGSGPAYIFLLQELFLQVAIEHKIAKKDAENLVKMLFLGSSKMASESRLDFKELKDSVTSKGGTTEAALNVLQENSNLANLLKKAVAAAAKKSEDLS